jgi:hypothetical protein
MGALLVILYAFPQIFGFRVRHKRSGGHSKSLIPLPFWFYVGLILWIGALALFAARIREPQWLVHWLLLPLFWGFTLVLDGLVYIRNGGRSLVAQSFRELVAIGMVSISGWLVFEWLNFFVKVNWYYPFATLLEHDEFLVYAVAGSSGLMPMAFEWYELLSTFPLLSERYRSGPAIRFSASVQGWLLVTGMAGLVGAAFFPDQLFFILWLAPLIIFSIVLEWLGIWTPFTPLAKGDWTPLLLFSLTYLIQGMLLECWNWISGFHPSNGALLTYNPAYWAYSVPYVNFLHIFEMPILGYLGYIPFGTYCWIWWISTSFVLNIHSGYTYSPEYRRKSGPI